MKQAARAISKSGAPARRIAITSCFLVAVFFGLDVTADAHDPGLSAAELHIGKGLVAAGLTFARTDLETISATTGTSITQTRLDELASRAVEIEVNGSRVGPGNVSAEFDDASGSVHFRLEYLIEGAGRARFSSPLVGLLPRGHRQYVAIYDARGRMLDERMLDRASEAIEIDVAEGATGIPFLSLRRFVGLGIEHILTGYDHLVFLLGLMIAGASVRAAAKIITSFTLAHSITLALATLDVVRLSPRVVEPLIAASIIYIGVENIFRREMGRRWVLTFGFGLVHGFGFASALKELGIGANGASAAIPLLSFNLGVEMGQVAIAAIALPVIWKLRDRPLFVARCAPACSVLISLAGGFWFLERTLA